MMKTIYVTIEEFEKNGGVLENGREIFSAGPIAYYEYNAKEESEHCIWVKGTKGSGTVRRDTGKVAIECTPIYK